MTEGHVPPRVARTILAAALLSALFACSDQSAPTAPYQGDATVRGTVMAEKTSTGVAGLVVALLHGDTVVRATPTDDHGEFEFRGLARGSYTVALTGFDLANIDTRYTAFTPVAESVVADARPVDLVFAAVGLIAPHIMGMVTCGGTPVAGAQVRVIGGATDETVATNAQGMYGATDLAAGHYAVILLSAPCAITPSYSAAALLPGQAVHVDFQG